MSARVERARAIDAPVSVPVAIIGAGACGLTAALRVREAGLECVVLERDPSPGGSTALSSGFVPACETAVQLAAGVDDSIARFAADIDTKTRGTAATHLVDAYTRASGAAIDWLSSHESMPFELLDGFLYPGHSVRRMHAMPERTGRALIDRLFSRACARGVDVLCDAHATTLVADATNRVLGLRYRRPDARVEALACDVLLLACNGYGGNPERVSRHLAEVAGAAFAGHAGNDGSALDWGEELGAASADLGGYQGHGSWAIPHGMLITWALMSRGAVQINAAGNRFHDESGGYSEAAVAVLGQPDGQAWTVFDESLEALANEFPDYRDARRAGAVREASDVATLAELIGCRADRLGETLAEVRAAAASGLPDRYGRRHERALTAPYRTVRVTGALFHTQGGLDIDSQCRVLGRDARVLPNLLAAGGAARGVSGNAVWGYLSGNGLLSAIAGGYIAGASAARLARTGAPSIDGDRRA